MLHTPLRTLGSLLESRLHEGAQCCTVLAQVHGDRMLLVDLETVVLARIVARGDHDSEVHVERTRRVPEHIGRAHADIDDIRLLSQSTSDECVTQHGARHTRIPPFYSIPIIPFFNTYLLNIP